MIASASAFVPSSCGGKGQLVRQHMGASSENEKEMSKALPFVARPKLLDGALPGDVGFE